MSTHVTVAQLAAQTRRPVRSIRRHCARGIIPGAELVGHQWVIPRAGAEEYARNWSKYSRMEKKQ